MSQVSCQVLIQPVWHPTSLLVNSRTVISLLVNWNKIKPVVNHYCTDTFHRDCSGVRRHHQTRSQTAVRFRRGHCAKNNHHYQKGRRRHRCYVWFGVGVCSGYKAVGKWSVQNPKTIFLMLLFSGVWRSLRRDELQTSERRHQLCLAHSRGCRHGRQGKKKSHWLGVVFPDWFISFVDIIPRVQFRLSSEGMRTKPKLRRNMWKSLLILSQLRSEVNLPALHPTSIKGELNITN